MAVCVTPNTFSPLEIRIWWWEEPRLLFAGVSDVVVTDPVVFLATCDLWKDSQAPSLQKGLLSHPGYHWNTNAIYTINVLYPRCARTNTLSCAEMTKILIYIPGEWSPNGAQR